MFDKDDSIFKMINDGVDIDTIRTEIDKCQILCLACHHKVTDIERKLGFTRIKQAITRHAGAAAAADAVDDHADDLVHYQALYETKMKSVYGTLTDINEQSKKRSKK